MDGALVEIGPFRVKGDKLVPNSGSWHKYANLLFVDQPVAVGLSTSDENGYISEMSEMATDMITFLEKYFKSFPEQLENDLYLAGESYAGQFIPYIADAIQARNNNITDEETEFRLKGLMIGNGWIDPRNQYPAYLPFAYETGLVKTGSAVAATLEHTQKECVTSLEEKGSNLTIYDSTCDRILTTMLKEMYQETKLDKMDPNACVNMYDIRLHDTYSSCGMNWPEDLKSVTPYLRRAEVLSALNIEESNQVKWNECNLAVTAKFRPQTAVPAIDLIPGLIDQGLKVLLFNGDQDLICNWRGAEKMIENLSWGGEASSGFLDTKAEKSEDWFVNGATAGTFQMGRNLTFIRIYNGSHMVAVDVPDVAMTMAFQFIRVPGYDLQTPGGIKTEGTQLGDDNTPSGYKNSATEESKEDDEKNEDDETSAETGEENTDNETDSERLQSTFQSHSLTGGLILFVVILFVLVMIYMIKRNQKLVADAGKLNRARSGRGTRDESDPSMPTSNTNGFMDRIFSTFSRWRHGNAQPLSTDDFDEASVPLTRLDMDGSRASLDSIDSILDDAERESEASNKRRA